MPPEFESEFLPDFRKCDQNEFNNLIATNRFYYRVFNKSARSDPKHDGFVARKYSGRNAGELPNLGAYLLEDSHAVPKHINWGNRSPTGWISSSSEWAWAVVELFRRTRRGDPAQVAVIDSHALRERGEQNGRASHFYASNLLNILLKENVSIERELFNFANAAAEVLFHGWIPAKAIVSVFTLDEILPSLPRYMIRDSAETGLAWFNKPGIRYFREKNHEYLTKTHIYKQNWLKDHGIACGALACLFLDTMIAEVTDSVRQSSSVVEIPDPTIAHIRGRAISPYSGADRPVSSQGDAYVGGQRRSRLLNMMPAPAMQAAQPRGTDDMSVHERPRSPAVHGREANRESIHGCLGDLAFMQFMQWGRKKLRILLDLNEKISPGASEPAGEIEPGNSHELDAGLSVPTRSLEPNWVTDARTSIERLKGTILDLASTIAHWLVLSFPREEWLEIKEGIEDSVRERLRSLEDLVGPYELPGGSTAGPMTKEMSNFENGKYPKVEMKYC